MMNQSYNGYNYNTTEKAYESITSEGASAVSIAGPMSTSGSTVGDESLSSMRDHILPCGVTYAHQKPQVYMQQVGAPAYQPLMYDQRYHTQQNYNFQPMQMVVPSPGYVNMVPRQVQAVSPMRNVSQPRPLQTQNIHPINQHQGQTPPQYWASMPVSNAARRMVTPVSYSPMQETNTNSQQVSPNVFSSAMNTPVPNYYSSPGYPYGYINTPVMSSVPCTPNAYFMASTDVPPVFHLNNQNLRRSTIPERISCSINPAPVPSELERTNVSPAPVSTAVCHSPMETTASNTVSVPTAANNIEQSAAVEREEDEDLWSGFCKYAECQDNGGSNLFVTWSGSHLELSKKLRQYKLDVRQVLSTNDENVFNVVFESHPSARKAFTMQREIRLRMVPPRNSHRNWLRNPSPKFLVKFETRRRLPVKKGKAECHDLVGELLMSNCQEQKGCVIWADQLKGHRIRVVSCDGNFMFPGGRVVQMKGVSTDDDANTSLGWISYRCKHTRESFVIRQSGNLLGDYVYRG